MIELLVISLIVVNNIGLILLMTSTNVNDAYFLEHKVSKGLLGGLTILLGTSLLAISVIENAKTIQSEVPITPVVKVTLDKEGQRDTLYIYRR